MEPVSSELARVRGDVVGHEVYLEEEMLLGINPGPHMCQVRDLPLTSTPVTQALETHSKPLILQKRKGVLEKQGESFHSLFLFQYFLACQSSPLTPQPSFSHGFREHVSVHIFVSLSISVCRPFSLIKIQFYSAHYSLFLSLFFLVFSLV